MEPLLIDCGALKQADCKNVSVLEMYGGMLARFVLISPKPWRKEYG